MPRSVTLVVFQGLSSVKQLLTENVMFFSDLVEALYDCRSRFCLVDLEREYAIFFFRTCSGEITDICPH